MLNEENEEVKKYSRLSDGIRVDLKLVAALVDPNSRVLDVGCGDGSLLRYLVEKRTSMVEVSRSVNPGFGLVFCKVYPWCKVMQTLI